MDRILTVINSIHCLYKMPIHRQEDGIDILIIRRLPHVICNYLLSVVFVNQTRRRQLRVET